MLYIYITDYHSTVIIYIYNNAYMVSLPSGKRLHIAIENDPVEIVDLPIENGGSFHSFLYVYQRVYMPILGKFMVS